MISADADAGRNKGLTDREVIRWRHHVVLVNRGVEQFMVDIQLPLRIADALDQYVRVRQTIEISNVFRLGRRGILCCDETIARVTVVFPPIRVSIRDGMIN